MMRSRTMKACLVASMMAVEIGEIVRVLDAQAIEQRQDHQGREALCRWGEVEQLAGP